MDRRQIKEAGGDRLGCKTSINHYNMLKVSFKDTKFECFKTVVKKGKHTSVGLRGSINIPSLGYIPLHIMEWMHSVKKVILLRMPAHESQWGIYAVGTARCREGDKYDSILGERIAEGRAKKLIYEFVAELTGKLCDYYTKQAFGEGGLQDTTKRYSNLAAHEEKHLVDLLGDGK